MPNNAIINLKALQAALFNARVQADPELAVWQLVFELPPHPYDHRTKEQVKLGNLFAGLARRWRALVKAHPEPEGEVLVWGMYILERGLHHLYDHSYRNHRAVQRFLRGEGVPRKQHDIPVPWEILAGDPELLLARLRCDPADYDHEAEVELVIRGCLMHVWCIKSGLGLRVPLRLAPSLEEEARTLHGELCEAKLIHLAQFST